MDKWFAIAACVFFITLFGGMFATEAVTGPAKQNTKAACFNAQAEAARQHVEFKTDCSKL